MNKKKIYWVVAASVVIENLLVTTFFGKDLSRIGWIDFTALFNRVYLGTVLLILLMLVLDSSLKTHNFSIKTTRFWLIGFTSILFISFSMTYYANPHDRFSVQRYLFLDIRARNIKTALYEKTNYDPQIIILGSSRAFTFAPEYIYQKTGYNAFNFSVESATLFDYFWQLKYILSKKKEGQRSPQVLVIDLAAYIPSGLNTATAAQKTFAKQPLVALPYLSLSQQKEVLFAYGEDTMSIQSVSDSLYLIAHPFLTPKVQAITFQADGFGIRKPVTPEEYRTTLQSDLKDYKYSGAGNFCTELDRQGVDLLEQLVSTAEQNHIGVVLYQSPLNEAVLQKIILTDDRFYQCQKLLTDLVNRLKSSHKNVWFIDLITYQPITSMKEDGFYDTMHLRENASQAVIDQLLPSIQMALQWSKIQTK
ncbi:MAG: hypothetical protein IPP66_02130 [Anaerolineales bacterium]|nr:hypothetical protein [Anaerolineales bacterium]